MRMGTRRRPPRSSDSLDPHSRRSRALGHPSGDVASRADRCVRQVASSYQRTRPVFLRRLPPPRSALRGVGGPPCGSIPRMTAVTFAEVLAFLLGAVGGPSASRSRRRRSRPRLIGNLIGRIVAGSKLTASDAEGARSSTSSTAGRLRSLARGVPRRSGERGLPPRRPAGGRPVLDRSRPDVGPGSISAESTRYIRIASEGKSPASSGDRLKDCDDSAESPAWRGFSPDGPATMRGGVTGRAAASQNPVGRRARRPPPTCASVPRTGRRV
jgi:hypothetical protein